MSGRDFKMSGPTSSFCRVSLCAGFYSLTAQVQVREADQDSTTLLVREVESTSRAYH